MTSRLLAIGIALMFVVVPGAAWSASGDTDADTEPDYAAAFERLKGLVGTWVGESDSNRQRVTYHLTGGGAALVETFSSLDDPEGRSGMSTVYHMDGDVLMLTHYCGAQNQPRMKAVSYDPHKRRVRFEMIDITNLSSPDDYHTQEVVLGLQDEGHAFVEFNGSDSEREYPVHYELTRR